MVTNYPQQLTAEAEYESHGRRQPMASFVSRAVGRIGQVLCGLRGHDSVLHFEGKRVKCAARRADTTRPGWEISGRGPRRRYEGDAGGTHCWRPQRLRSCARPPESRAVAWTARRSASVSAAAAPVARQRAPARRGTRSTSCDVHVFLDAVQARAAGPEQHRRDSGARREPPRPSRSSSRREAARRAVASRPRFAAPAAAGDRAGARRAVARTSGLSDRLELRILARAAAPGSSRSRRDRVGRFRPDRPPLQLQRQRSG